MMRQGVYTLTENREIAKNTYLIRLTGDTSQTAVPGRFVNIRIDGCYLRRPISVCDSSPDGELTLIFKAVGRGTRILADTKPGASLDLLTGLGNGYDLTVNTRRPLLIGGGAGVPPMYLLCRGLREAGREVSVILGFNSRDEVFFEREFNALGAKVYVATADGSYGKRGFVTALMPDIDYDYFFTCGPGPMLRAVYDASGNTDGQFSFEERMGCGFGACMGCTCKTKYGNKRICRDGPVLTKEEIVW